MNKAMDISLGLNRPMESQILKIVSELRECPLLRCENCTKSQEELKNRSFMICSACKSKLDFLVHYCSSYAGGIFMRVKVMLIDIPIGSARMKIGVGTRGIVAKRKPPRN